MELGIAYELTGPDGTVIVFGNCDAAKADPNYVGWLDPDQGIAGLDGPDVVERAQQIIDGNGGIHFDFFHGRRPIVINGVLDPNVAIGTVLAREQKVKRATNAMVADALLRWTNTGYPKRRLALRRQAPPRITGRRPKSWQAGMVDADYRILSDAENVSAVQNIGAARIVANAGDELATPRLEVTAGGAGAGHVIELVNDTTGLAIQMKPGFDMAAGKLLVVDLTPPFPTVTYDGADAYDMVDFLPTDWWGLLPGNNSIRVAAGSGAGTFIVKSRDAWI